MHTIYKIALKENPNKVYIGCTVDIDRRIKQHFNMSAGEKTGTEEFRALKKQYGIEGFEVGILKITDNREDEDKEIKRHIAEGYYMFNQKPGANGNWIPRTEEQKQRTRDACRWRARAIYVKDMQGNIQWFYGINECCRVLGLREKTVSAMLTGKKKQKIHRGYSFSYA